MNYVIYKMGRGDYYLGEEDGKINYYLYSGGYYKMVSPDNLWVDSHVLLLQVGSNGVVHSLQVDNEVGGVQF